VPEYPDITIYIERLKHFLSGEILQQVRIFNPFLLRTVEPSIETIVNKQIVGFQRLGKRIIFVFPDEHYLLFHLMISGRFLWRQPGAKISAKISLAAFDFSKGSLWLTEVSSKKRASLHLVKGNERLAYFDSGGLEIFDISLQQFRDRLTFGNHTLKRTLTDPSLFSGIGNAYSDEILFQAKLSPIQLSQKMTAEQIKELFLATRQVLKRWTDILRRETADGFPEKVTAFREEMAVHGKFGKPCPVCTAPIQRIRYADNETNYCPVCQTGGKLLADRSLSRLLKNDWPRSFEEWEEKKAAIVAVANECSPKQK